MYNNIQNSSGARTNILHVANRTLFTQYVKKKRQGVNNKQKCWEFTK